MANKTNFSNFDIDDWVNYLTKKLNLNAYDSNTLLHDINNLRGDEWLSSIKQADIPVDAIKAYRRFLQTVV